MDNIIIGLGSMATGFFFLAILSAAAEAWCNRREERHREEERRRLAQAARYREAVRRVYRLPDAMDETAEMVNGRRSA